MSNASNFRIVGIDLETGGLNPKEHAILEVGVIIWEATPELPEVARFHAYPADYGKIDEFCLKMHTENGLLSIHEQADWLPGLQATEDDLCCFLVKHGTPKNLILMGSSVGFDIAFLRERMPRVLQYVHYRNLDVTAVAMAVNLLGGRSNLMHGISKPEDRQHRVFSDLEHSRKLLLGQAFTPPGSEGVAKATSLADPMKLAEATVAAGKKSSRKKDQDG